MPSTQTPNRLEHSSLGVLIVRALERGNALALASAQRRPTPFTAA
jgi:hypothetical protein